MNQPKILIVDDEPNVRFVIERTLKREGYLLDTAADGAEAVNKIKGGAFDLILLDLQMGPVGGVEVLNAARTHDADMVVIILTAHSSIESAVEALRLGAFDYLFKPATAETIRECVAKGLQRRQQALYRTRLLNQIEGLRHTLTELEGQTGTLDQTLNPGRFRRTGKLVIDMHHRIITFEGRLLDLTTTEFNILACLVEAAPESVSPRKLVNEALNYDAEEVEARAIIKWHIHHLRQKVEPDPLNPRYIKTIRYKGYMWSGK